MFKSVKNISFVLTLGLGLVIGHTSWAADDMGAEAQAAKSATVIPTTFTSEDPTISEMIANDPIKNFAFQAKGYGEQQAQKCPCSGCECFGGSSLNLWDKIRDAEDTASAEIKGLMQQYANHDHTFDRLPTEMKSWLKEQGYRTQEEAEEDPLGGLLTMLRLRAVLSMLSGDDSFSFGMPGIRVIRLGSSSFEPSSADSDEK